MISRFVLEEILFLLTSVEETHTPPPYPKWTELWNPKESGISVEIFHNQLKTLLQAKNQVGLPGFPLFQFYFKLGVSCSNFVK